MAKKEKDWVYKIWEEDANPAYVREDDYPGDPDDEAERYAEEYGLDDGDIVFVEDVDGIVRKYHIKMYMEPQFEAHEVRE